MNKQDVCQYCEQSHYSCPCDKVDRFFSDNWDLMYKWDSQAEYKFAYAVPKNIKKTVGGSAKSEPTRKKVA
jgi:hypothetical protein